MLLVWLVCQPILGALSGGQFTVLPIAQLAAQIFPIRVVCRARNDTFQSGQAAMRMLRIFNDTHSNEPIDMEWSLRSGGKAYAEGAETFTIEPGKSEEYALTIHVPPFPTRSKGELMLTCLRGGQQVYRVVRKCVIITAPKGFNPKAQRSTVH